MIDPKDKEWIDNASYHTLLRRWRHAPTGDTIFQGDAGQYYAAMLITKRDALPDGEAVNVSKQIGW